jgi:hypothetical protein
MAGSFHRLLKFIVGSFTALQGGAATAATELPRPHVASQSEALTMPAFITRLRQNAALRARFARDPRGVLRGHGIDPSPFKLADRFDEAELERLLAGWAAGAQARVRLAQATPQPPAAPEPPAVVYGPPPGPPAPPRPPAPDAGPPPPAPDADRPVPKADRPMPPAPVYGPPAGLPPQRR